MPVTTNQIRGVSCSERVKAGFVMGFIIGATIGGFYGGSNAFRAGLAGGELARVVGKNMINVGASCGGFMCIGTLLRC